MDYDNKHLNQIISSTIMNLSEGKLEEKLAFLRQNKFFYQFPVRQILQIHGQNPEARQLATFDKWLELDGRRIKPGTTAIKVITGNEKEHAKRYSIQSEEEEYDEVSL